MEMYGINLLSSFSVLVTAGLAGLVVSRIYRAEQRRFAKVLLVAKEVAEKGAELNWYQVTPVFEDELSFVCYSDIVCSLVRLGLLTEGNYSNQITDRGHDWLAAERNRRACQWAELDNARVRKLEKSGNQATQNG